MSDFSTMEDADLEASLMDVEEEAQAEEEVTSPAGDEPVTPEQPETPVDEAKPDDWNPEGPGDLKVALKKKQEEAAQAKAKAAELETRLQEYERQKAADAEEARINEARAEYHRIKEEDGQEAADAFEAKWQAGEYRTLAERAEQEKVQIRIEASAQAIMAVTPDYVDRIKQLQTVFSDHQLDAMAAHWASQGLNPALMAYNLSKEKFPTEQDLEARINERVAAKLKEAQNKTNPPATRGHETIAHISSGTQAPVKQKPVRKMTDKELERSLRE